MMPRQYRRMRRRQVTYSRSGDAAHRSRLYSSLRHHISLQWALLLSMSSSRLLRMRRAAATPTAAALGRRVVPPQRTEHRPSRARTLLLSTRLFPMSQPMLLPMSRTPLMHAGARRRTPWPAECHPQAPSRRRRGPRCPRRSICPSPREPNTLEALVNEQAAALANEPQLPTDPGPHEEGSMAADRVVHAPQARPLRTGGSLSCSASPCRP